jgi:hypothetical protein
MSRPNTDAHHGQHLQGCVSCYAHVEARRAEFDALLVGPPTTGGLIRHRARRPRGRLLRFVSGVVDALGGWLR